MKRIRKLYNSLADKYDFRHSNPTTLYLRDRELSVLQKYACGKILDIGCGTGYHLRFLDNVIGGDISEEMLKRIRAGWKPVIQCDIENIPFKNGTFDTVISMFSVLNVCNYRRAVREMARVCSCLLYTSPSPRDRG